MEKGTTAKAMVDARAELYGAPLFDMDAAKAYLYDRYSLQAAGAAADALCAEMSSTLEGLVASGELSAADAAELCRTAGADPETGAIRFTEDDADAIYFKAQADSAIMLPVYLSDGETVVGELPLQIM